MPGRRRDDDAPERPALGIAVVGAGACCCVLPPLLLFTLFLAFLAEKLDLTENGGGGGGGGGDDGGVSSRRRSRVTDVGRAEMANFNWKGSANLARGGGQHGAVHAQSTGNARPHRHRTDRTTTARTRVTNDGSGVAGAFRVGQRSARESTSVAPRTAAERIARSASGCRPRRGPPRFAGGAR